jgi:hypothetical protein
VCTLAALQKGEPLARRPWGLKMATGGMVKEVLGEGGGMEVDGGVGYPSRQREGGKEGQQQREWRWTASPVATVAAP